MPAHIRRRRGIEWPTRQRADFTGSPIDPKWRDGAYLRQGGVEKGLCGGLPHGAFLSWP
jgi:hypothetical protein